MKLIYDVDTCYYRILSGDKCKNAAYYDVYLKGEGEDEEYSQFDSCKEC